MVVTMGTCDAGSHTSSKADVRLCVAIRRPLELVVVVTELIA